MKTYMLRRLLFSVFSLAVVTGTVMWMTYSLMDRNSIFVNDSTIIKYTYNEKEIYKYNSWEQYGYINYVNFASYAGDKYYALYGDEYTQHEDYQAAIQCLNNKDTYLNNTDVQEFEKTYQSAGYQIKYLEPKYTGKGLLVSNPYLISVKDKNAFERLGNYVSKMFSIETVNDVKDTITNRYIRWEWDERSHMPALVGNGTTHKYLIYFDNKFPFIHQNIFHINLGKSNVNFQGTDTMVVMKSGTGETVFTDEEYPADIGTGVKHSTSLDFHTVTYSSSITAFDESIYGEGQHYINASQFTAGFTRIGNSFLIGIIATILCYIFGLPLGVWMARKKDKLVDNLGNLYIIFIMAVPSLAYIFIFSAIGIGWGLPSKFGDKTVSPWMWFVLPVISLGLPAMGGLMKWARRYTIDQSNSDYVKFARSTGMTETEIFNKHIFRNALIYIIHGIPADILFSLTGALITERVYSVPGVGGLLTDAITAHDNGIIIGGTVFYTFLSILALLLGDILLATYDPRVSLTDERR